eukprot:gene2656-1654_t
MLQKPKLEVSLKVITHMWSIKPTIKHLTTSIKCNGRSLHNPGIGKVLYPLIHNTARNCHVVKLRTNKISTHTHHNEHHASNHPKPRNPPLHPKHHKYAHKIKQQIAAIHRGQTQPFTATKHTIKVTKQPLTNIPNSHANYALATAYTLVKHPKSTNPLKLCEIFKATNAPLNQIQTSYATKYTIPHRRPHHNQTKTQNPHKRRIYRQIYNQLTGTSKPITKTHNLILKQSQISITNTNKKANLQQPTTASHLQLVNIKPNVTTHTSLQTALTSHHKQATQALTINTVTAEHTLLSKCLDTSSHPNTQTSSFISNYTNQVSKLALIQSNRNLTVAQILLDTYRKGHQRRNPAIRPLKTKGNPQIHQPTGKCAKLRIERTTNQYHKASKEVHTHINCVIQVSLTQLTCLISRATHSKPQLLSVRITNNSHQINYNDSSIIKSTAVTTGHNITASNTASHYSTTEINAIQSTLRNPTNYTILDREAYQLPKSLNTKTSKIPTTTSSNNHNPCNYTNPYQKATDLQGELYNNMHRTKSICVQLHQSSTQMAKY